MRNYRFREGFSHVEKGQRLEAGAVVTMSDRRYNSLKDRFELINEYEEIEIPEVMEEIDELGGEIEELDDEIDGSEGEDYSDWIAELASLPAKQARKTVAVIDEVDILLALLEKESRSTVVTAIEDRIEELV